MFKNTLKLTLAACLLLAVGWSIILLNSPQEPVKEAKADIAMLSFAPKSQQQRFVEGLQELGMEKPRAYDWNGNKVFFSMMQTKDTAQQVLEKAHRIYKDKGLNKTSKPILPPSMQPYLEEYSQTKNISDPEAAKRDIDEVMASYNDFFSGGLIPVKNEPHHVILAGGTGHGKNITDVVSYLRAQKEGKRNLIDQVKSMQTIEATRNPGATHTLVTAVWSDNDLDMKRFANEGQDINVSHDIPACPGCNRLMALGAESPQEKGYRSLSFLGTSSRDSTIHFYDRSLGARGWKRMESSMLFEQLKRTDVPMRPPTNAVAYVRDDKFITLDVTATQEGTFVQLLESP